MEDYGPAMLTYLSASLSALTRFFYRTNSKLHRKREERLYRISLKSSSGLSSTYLNISTTTSQFMRQMTYSLFHTEYFLEIWLPPRAEFYITQHFKEITLSTFPQIAGKQGRMVNMIPSPVCYKPAFTSKVLRSPSLRDYWLESSGYSIGKSPDCNEDAYFCTDSVIGVADGIGSFKTEFGISSREFSSELMHRCQNYVNSFQSKGSKWLKCKEIISQAYDLIESGGGSTFTLASLSGRKINILNLGDSGLILIRRNGSHSIAFQTTAKTHGFNTPYQLSRRFSLQQLQRVGKEFSGFDKTDGINDSDEFIITTVPGDVIIMGTDGLWDNVYPEEILKLMDLYYMRTAEEIARVVVNLARIRAVGDKVTPFSESAKALVSKMLKFSGGKIDDITVVVAKVRDEL